MVEMIGGSIVDEMEKDIFLAFTEPVWFNMVSVLKKYQKAVM